MADPVKTPVRGITFGAIPPAPTPRSNAAREAIEIRLRYEGPDVDDGSMSIEDIVPVLQGFSSAYGKLAIEADPKANHRVRIVGVRPGSANIILEAWKSLQTDGTTNTLTNITVLGGAAYWIVTRIIGVIQAKRHVKKQPFQERISANNTIVITNVENVLIELTLDVYELFKGGSLDADLSKMTRPLVKGRIDAAEIEATPADGIVLRERITAEERPYFEVEEVSVTTTKETWLVAKLTQVNKNTNSGFVHLSDGTRVFFKYVGQDPQDLYRAFAYDGPVRIFCVAFLDESLKINMLEVSVIERAQGELFPDIEPSSDEEER